MKRFANIAANGVILYVILKSNLSRLNGWPLNLVRSYSVTKDCVTAPHSSAEAYTSRCKKNLQLSLQTNKRFCGDLRKASLYASVVQLQARGPHVARHSAFGGPQKNSKKIFKS